MCPHCSGYFWRHDNVLVAMMWCFMTHMVLNSELLLACFFTNGFSKMVRMVLVAQATQNEPQHMLYLQHVRDHRWHVKQWFRPSIAKNDCCLSFLQAAVFQLNLLFLCPVALSLNQCFQISGTPHPTKIWNLKTWCLPSLSLSFWPFTLLQAFRFQCLND